MLSPGPVIISRIGVPPAKATAVHFIVLVPQFLGKQVGNGTESPGVIHQAATQHTEMVLQVLSPVRMGPQATDLPIIQPVTLFPKCVAGAKMDKESIFYGPTRAILPIITQFPLADIGRNASDDGINGIYSVIVTDGLDMMHGGSQTHYGFIRQHFLEAPEMLVQIVSKLAIVLLLV